MTNNNFDQNQLRGQPANKGSWVANENGEPEASLRSDAAPAAIEVAPGITLRTSPTTDADRFNFGREIGFVSHWTYGDLRVARDQYNMETYVVEGRDGNVTFNAPPNESDEDLLTQALKEFRGDARNQRGRGLNHLGEWQRDQLEIGYVNAALTGVETNLNRWDLSDEAEGGMRRDFERFLSENHGLLGRARRYYGCDDYEKIGAAFLNDRNCSTHGFRSLELGELGEQLEDSANGFGEVRFYDGQDGYLYPGDE